MEKTIVAISTPLGTGGIAVIRMSGEDALRIAFKCFDKFCVNPTPRHAYYGKLTFPKGSDDIIAIYFEAPNSYTGENMVEFHIHGGYFWANTVVEELIALGATMAERGEFSKRAIMNGKMDLSQAEGVIDQINAQSEAELRASGNLRNGWLKNFVTEMQGYLKNCLAQCDVALDYPEHDEEFITTEQVLKVVNYVSDMIQDKLKTVNTGSKIKNGVNVAICGTPNAGKSSLLNAMLGYNRAIVTEIPGTTRDTITESYQFNGVRFNIEDTAGLRKSDDLVEKEGIERAKQSMGSADIIVWLHDMTQPFDRSILPEQNKLLVVGNKQDLVKDNLGLEFDYTISTKSAKSVEQLKELIYNQTIDQEQINRADIMTNERHIQKLAESLFWAHSVQNGIKEGGSLDCIALPLMSMWQSLGEITGENCPDSVLDEVFSKFCLGK